MTEQHDDRAPWVPEGMREFKVGDMVRFKMGERVPVACPNCKAIVTHEKIPVEIYSVILWIGLDEGIRDCESCERPFPMTVIAQLGGYRFAIKYPHTYKEIKMGGDTCRRNRANTG